MASLHRYFILAAVFHLALICRANFVKHPSNNAHLHGVLKHSLDLVCNYTGSDGNGQFLEWFRDDSPISLEKRGHYIVKQTEKYSQLTIKIFVPADAQIGKWSVTTSKPGYEKRPACEFDRISVLPSPQGMETNLATEKMDTAHESIRRIEDKPLALRCVILPEPTAMNLRNKIQWQYSTDDIHYSPVSGEDVQIDGDTLSIEQVKKAHRGYYRCTMNDISFTVLLRVKDRLAALWPLLGILGIILTLVIIILFFETRNRAANRLITNDDEDTDHANNPLVRSANRSSDADNKKRAIKA